MRTLLLCSLVVVALAACKKDQSSPSLNNCVYNCDELPMYIFFSGTHYLSEEVDTIIVRQYTGDGTFSSLLSETLKTFVDSGQYDQYGAIIQKDVFGDGNDYEIVIPGAGQAYRIWDIAAANKTETTKSVNCNAGHYSCYGAVKDFEISGGAYSLLSGDAYTIMLQH